MPSRRRSFALLLVSIVMGGCGSAARNGAAFETLPLPKQRFETETAQVYFKDERKGVSQSRTFDTPVFSWPGDCETRAVAGSSEMQAEMAALLKRWVPRVGSDRLYFEVYLHRADAGWNAYWFSEEAWATVELRVCAIDGTDHSVLFAGEATSYANASSMDVTDSEPARLVDAAVLNAWGRWVQSDRVIAAVNQALVEKRRWGGLLNPVSCEH
jgi:hypothetical protein